MAVFCTAITLSTVGCGDSNANDKKDTSSEAASSPAASSKKTNTVLDEEGNIDYDHYVQLGDYSKIELSTSSIDENTQSQIDDNIKALNDYKKSKKGKVKLGDTINIYYVGKIDGETFEGGSCTKEDNPEGFNLEIGSGNFIDGFEDVLIGKTIGKEYKIEASFPEEYPPNEELAGKPAVFTVTINYKVIYPELTDELVKKNFKDFDENYKNTADDYAKYIRSNMIRDMAWDYVYISSTVTEYPEDMLEEVKVQYVTPITYYLSKNGTTLEEYLEAAGMSQEDFDSQVEKSAKTDLEKRLIFGAIFKKENKEVSEEEYKEILDQYLKEYSCDDQEALDKLFEQYYGTASDSIINNEIIYSNVVDLLAENVKEI